jgi:hypothetical protein
MIRFHVKRLVNPHLPPAGRAMSSGSLYWRRHTPISYYYAEEFSTTTTHVACVPHRINSNSSRLISSRLINTSTEYKDKEEDSIRCHFISAIAVIVYIKALSILLLTLIKYSVIIYLY